MTRARIVRALVAVSVLGLTVAATGSDEGVLHLRAQLSGFQEVPPKLTTGSGTFEAVVRGDSMTYTLTYSDLSSDAFMAHIHFAQKGVNGGIFIWLCGPGTLTNPAPAGTPDCPRRSGTVTRTVGGGAVRPVADQGVRAGNFEDALRVLRSGEAYANVHTATFPGGEIRGQVSVNGASGE